MGGEAYHLYSQVRRFVLREISGLTTRVMDFGGRALASMIPGATFVAIPRGGHVPTTTRPGEVSDAIHAQFA